MLCSLKYIYRKYIESYTIYSVVINVWIIPLFLFQCSTISCIDCFNIQNFVCPKWWKNNESTVYATHLHLQLHWMKLVGFTQIAPVTHDSFLHLVHPHIRAAEQLKWVHLFILTLKRWVEVELQVCGNYWRFRVGNLKWGKNIAAATYKCM